MPRVRSSWLIGSIEQLPEQDVTIDGSAETVPEGPYYLTHATDAISLLDAVVAAMTSAGVVAPAAVILENRRVRLSSSGVFTVTWTDTQLRDLLGFTGNLAGASSYTATNISPLLWSGGYTATREVLPGSTGYDVEDLEIRVSADGTEQEVDHHATHTWDEWAWDAVVAGRYDNPGGAPGGTWIGFRRAVLVPGYRFQLVEPVVEDEAGTAAVTLPTATGTYRLRELPEGKGRRKLDNANTYWTVGCKVRLATEYS
jgi:hypothetical protein